MTEQNRVYPMRLYATWEVDRTSSSCVPRSCVLAFDRLTVLRNVDENFSTSLIVAVKLQGYKRTLRSNDINVSVNNGIIDVDLDITFTLQYPHFVKRKSINLFVMIQRRKKYKTRPILGFKTLAVGVINLNQVLQNSSSCNRELNLFTNVNKKMDEKSRNLPDAKLYINCLSTQPLEHEDLKGKNANVVYESADDDDDDDSTPNEEATLGVGSDGEQQQQPSKPSRRRRTTIAATSSASKSGAVVDDGKLHRRQKNLKQRFVNLLRRFKVAEEGLGNADDFRGDVGADQIQAPTQREIDALFEELENLSDSGPECDAGADALSVRSTPKPRLRPYFNSSSNVAGGDQSKTVVGGVASEESKETPSDAATTSDQELSDVAPPTLTVRKETPPATGRGDRRRSVVVADADVKTLKIRPVVEQLSASFGSSDDLTSTNVNPIILIGVQDVTSQAFVNCLTAQCKDSKIFLLSALNDVKTVFNALLNRIQRFCNVNAVHPPCLKMVLVGGDKFLSICLRAYVESFAPKPNEWLHFVKFYLISQGGSSVNRYLCALDRTYGQLFSTNQNFDKPDPTNQECQEWANRIARFLGGAKSTVCLPLAEVMLQLKEKGFNDETTSTQIFVPFVGDVRLGASVRMDSFGDENLTSATTPNAAAAVVGPAASKNQDFSPPGSPRFHTDAGKSPSQNLNDVQDLQVEYWTQTAQPQAQPVAAVVQPAAAGNAALSRKDTQNLLTTQPQPQPQAACVSVAAGPTLIVKQSVKTGFRSLSVSRAPSSGDFLTLNFIREKKRDKVLQKLGMKKGEKDQQEKKHTVENVSRLICSSTKQHGTMKVYIDGVEWSQVKFFQISTQWQTHVKIFPLALFNMD